MTVESSGNDNPASSNAAPQKRIGKYDVVRELGRGGMGIVYRAVDNQLGREVAIKTLTQGVSSDPGMLARFYEEGRKTGRLKHPNIVTVYDLGDDNGTPYIVMECVEGDPLDKVLRSQEDLAALPMVDRLRIVEEVCAALGYAHRNNVIHRDVKPANIFVQPDGRAKLLDFGIARLEKKSQDLSLTRAGHIIGTIPYMAPERLRDKFVDGRSDIFSAGVVLFQLVTGQLPFSGEDYVLMQKIMNEAHPPLNSVRKGLPAGLEPIIDRALAKLADERYQTGEEMATDLTTVIADLRQEQVVEMLPEARRLVEAGDLTRARSVLQQLLKIQSRHPEARELLAEIQKRLIQRQRDERIQQVRQQAQEAFENREYDQSLAIIRDGLELDANNTALLQMLQNVEQEKAKQDKIDEYLREADVARRRGDFKAAIAATQKALKVDQSNTRVVALNNALILEAEESKKRAQAQNVLDSVRSQLDARHYTDAIELLKKAEELDPTNPEVQLLLGDAKSGLEQLRRKESIARLEEEVSRATTIDQLQEVAESIQKAIVTMPAESSLFRLNAQVDRRIKELENRILVDETLQTCRDLSPREALEVVRKVRHRLPSDERLLSLEALLTERIEQQSLGERRAEYLSRARESLKARRYSDAVHILEACQAEGIAGEEIQALLEFARNEEAEDQLQSRLRSNLDRAQSLMAEGALDEAIHFLESSLLQLEDPALRILLDQAISARQSLQKQVDAALASAKRLVQAGKLQDAIHFLLKLPTDVQRAPRLQFAIATLEEERQQAIFRMTGRAYAALQTNLKAGERHIQRIAAAADSSEVATSIAIAFSSRSRDIADHAIDDAIRQGEQAIRSRDRAAAEGAAQAAAGVFEWAGPQARSNWQSMLSKMNKKGLLARPRS